MSKIFLAMTMAMSIYRTLCVLVLQIRPLLGETNFTLGPISKSIIFIILLFFDTGLLSPRIWGVRATFKAVLTAVDMK